MKAKDILAEGEMRVGACPSSKATAYRLDVLLGSCDVAIHFTSEEWRRIKFIHWQYMNRHLFEHPEVECECSIAK